MLETLKLTLKNLVLPTFCRQCDARLLTDENGFFCPTCWEMPTRIEAPFCARCGLPHKGRVGFGAIEEFPCAACRDAAPMSEGRVYGAVGYEGAIAQGIKLLKFGRKPRMALPLAQLMAEFVRQYMDLSQYQYIVPVPLYPVRERERGYNQAALLAQELISTFECVTLNRSLKRIRPTRAQSTLKSSGDRLANVLGAFAVDRAQTFNDSHILLVDDVVTSGGTVSECARALKRAGAGRVDAFAVALAGGHTDDIDV